MSSWFYSEFVSSETSFQRVWQPFQQERRRCQRPGCCSLNGALRNLQSEPSAETFCVVASRNLAFSTFPSVVLSFRPET